MTTDNASRALAARGSIPAGFKLAKRVTNTQLKMEEGRPYVLRFDGPIHKAQAEKTRRVDAPAPTGQKKEPPHLAHVTYYADGLEPQPCVIIVPAVLQSELENTYGTPSGDAGAYIGKTFLVVRHKVQGKDYNLFEITELEPETGAEHEVSRPDDQAPRGRRKG